MNEELIQLRKDYDKLLNIVIGYRYELDKLNHLARDISLIKVSDILKDSARSDNNGN